MAQDGAGKRLERRYEPLSGGSDRRFVYYIFRRHLGMSVEETDALPWWQRRMYLEEWTEDLRREGRLYADQDSDWFGQDEWDERKDWNRGEGGAFDDSQQRLHSAPPPPADASRFTGRPDYPPLPADVFRECRAQTMPGLERDKDPDSIEGIGQSFGISVRKI